MKRTIILLSLFMLSLSLYAIPVRPRTWKTIRLNDGTEIRAQLKGDEFEHYWQGTDGQQYVSTEDGYVLRTIVMENRARECRMTAQHHRARRASASRAAMSQARRAGFRGATSAYLGQKKGLIILVNFKDVKFQSGHDHALFEKIANMPGYTSSEGFVGSVADYFKAQSLGVFELTFDVAGPVTVSQNMAYYGANDSNGKDKNVGKMVTEAVNLAKSSVTDWSQYDWDGDGEVDQVMLIYAGESESYTGTEDTIWPHEWLLQYAASRVSVGNGLYVNTYAVSNEVDAVGNGYVLTGIGTICHEFSHCLGLHDMYDTAYEGHYGMNAWSLMDSGCYNGDGFRPAGYTSFERMDIGWTDPITLAEATTVTGLEALESSGTAYRIVNPGNSNEYYLIENRQQTGWDSALPAAGMLILHVDYDSDLWYINYVNTIETGYNDHQRCTIFHADGTDKTGVYSVLMDEAYMNADYQSYYQYLALYDADVAGDVYPQSGNNLLTNTSTPRDFTYKANTDGRKLMNISITGIRQDSDGTMSFVFGHDASGTKEGDNTDYGNSTDDDEDTDEPVVTPTDDYLFYESFNQCDGKGGNDNKWSGTIAIISMDMETYPDNRGWMAANGAYVANKCAKFGTSSKDGIAVTPAFTVNGTATLTFKAAAWNNQKDGTMLELSVSNGSISPASVTMTKGKWDTYTATITATGNVKVTFKAQAYRFFLDEVLAVDPDATAIQQVSTPGATAADTRIFTLDGRYAGTDREQLPRGVYIINGRKQYIQNQK